ncbi:class I SAM-dependent methyltransferase [Rhizobium mayense]|uniref:Class I SAM-dependent methyltransferase n=1 Tax=Rhizobium mayense TaxID=1312184 RepID=A0ABT7K5Q6_9HYPH|nr:class I SAM-dependent methyltransferase [Rhizobium mayense]MDL2403945.1 class I SAM-dependent methyltransferase [Rhizobium mayense]
MISSLAADETNFLRLEKLLRLRSYFGDIYGSTDLCVLLYVLAKRERPKCVVELGTGLGVCTAWLSLALLEVGEGHIWTFDDGSHLLKKEIVRNAATSVRKLFNLPPNPDENLKALFLDLIRELDLEGNVTFVDQHIDYDERLRIVIDRIDAKEINWLFSDISHGPKEISTIIGTFVPKMSEYGSIFIDSASNNIYSAPYLERVVPLLNAGLLPQSPDFKVWADGPQNMTSRVFELIHLREARDGPQNSTAWIRIHPK